MYVLAHRGTQTIGGSLVEVGSKRARLLFDAGANLPPLNGERVLDDFQLEGLTRGAPAFDAVFVSHHHNDHCGLLGRVLPKIPVYAGAETQRIMGVIADFTRQPIPAVARNFSPGEPVTVGDLTVTPVPVVHSARDAYMFLVQGEGQSVLYTGDFRTAEALPRLRALLGGAPPDLVICEGTNIRRSPVEGVSRAQGEADIQRRAAEWMERCDGTVFVLCSATNEDRIQALAQAADRTGRLLCEDLFQASVRQSRKTDRLERFIAFYVDRKKQPRVYPYFRKYLAEGGLKKAEELAALPEPKVLFVRASMERFLTKYLEAVPKGRRHVLLYSIWSGYKETPGTKKFLDFCRGKGLEIADLHSSGHAYRATIRELLEGLAPKALLPVHCQREDRPEFLTLHPNCWMLTDGERRELPR